MSNTDAEDKQEEVASVRSLLGIPDGSDDEEEVSTEETKSNLPFPEVEEDDEKTDVIPGETPEQEYDDDDEEDIDPIEEGEEEFPVPSAQDGPALPPQLTAQDLQEFEDDGLPEGFKVLFDESGDLTKMTETPPRMIIPLVRARVIDAAHDEERTDSLLEVFVKEFDRRMISKDRKGRLEAVELIKGLHDAETDDDEAFI